MEYLPIGTNLSILQDLWARYTSHGVQLLEKFKFVPQPTNVLVGIVGTNMQGA